MPMPKCSRNKQQVVGSMAKPAGAEGLLKRSCRLLFSRFFLSVLVFPVLSVH